MKTHPRQSVTERRRAPRTACEGSVCIYMTDKRPPASLACTQERCGPGQKGIQVKCRDLSRLGIGISCNHPLQVGGEFAVVIRKPDPVIILYGINRCSPNTHGSYDVGAQVLQVLHEVNAPAPETLSAEKHAFLRSLLCAASE